MHRMGLHHPAGARYTVTHTNNLTRLIRMRHARENFESSI